MIIKSRLYVSVLLLYFIKGRISHVRNDSLNVLMF